MQYGREPSGGGVPMHFPPLIFLVIETKDLGVAFGVSSNSGYCVEAMQGMNL